MEVFSMKKVVRNFKVMAVLLAAAAFSFSAGAGYAAQVTPEAGKAKAEPQLAFSTITHQEEAFEASIQVPILRGTGNAELEKRLNERFLEDAVAVYRSFVLRMGEMKDMGAGYFSIATASRIAAHGNGLLSLEHRVTETMASSGTLVRFDNIDLGTGREIALSDLFKDDRYTKPLTKIVKSLMKEEMKKDKATAYFLEEVPEVRKDQPFYIEDGKLVLVFDQGTVAPYSMGARSFVIPTKPIKGLLAPSQSYLK